MKIRKIGDVLRHHHSAEIRCMYTNNIARKLSRDQNNNVVLDSLVGEPIALHPDTPIIFEPWVMDRGSILFEFKDDDGVIHLYKLCGEFDHIQFEDGVEDRIAVDHHNVRRNDTGFHRMTATDDSRDPEGHHDSGN